MGIIVRKHVKCANIRFATCQCWTQNVIRKTLFQKQTVVFIVIYSFYQKESLKFEYKVHCTLTTRFWRLDFHKKNIENKIKKRPRASIFFQKRMINSSFFLRCLKSLLIVENSKAKYLKVSLTIHAC